RRLEPATAASRRRPSARKRPAPRHPDRGLGRALLRHRERRTASNVRRNDRRGRLLLGQQLLWRARQWLDHPQPHSGRGLGRALLLKRLVSERNQQTITSGITPRTLRRDKELEETS